MTNKEKLQKEYNKIVGEQINSGNEPQEDMYPIMSEIYHWGYHNISNKELKRIIERHSRT